MAVNAPFYYFPIVMCGYCDWQMVVDRDPAAGTPSDGPRVVIYFCSNSGCPQKGKRIRIKPLVGEYVEV